MLFRSSSEPSGWIVGVTRCRIARLGLHSPWHNHTSFMHHGYFLNGTVCTEVTTKVFSTFLFGNIGLGIICRLIYVYKSHMHNVCTACSFGIQSYCLSFITLYQRSIYTLHHSAYTFSGCLNTYKGIHGVFPTPFQPHFPTYLLDDGYLCLCLHLFTYIFISV